MTTPNPSMQGANAAMALLHKLGRIGQRALRTHLLLGKDQAEHQCAQLYGDYIDSAIDTLLRDQASGRRSQHD